MLLIKCFINLLVLHLVFGSAQINLDLTTWLDINTGSNDLQHDCLHVPASVSISNAHEVISYCMSEWPSKWNISNQIDPRFTFADLYKQNITSEQLYHWSAPMDIIENYQFYLNRMSISNVSSMENELYYNCTSPRFGPLCQYAFDGYENTNLSLAEIFDDYYHKPYVPKTLTCYTHLMCDTGSTSKCLDWSDICDGKIDCIDGNDEKNCVPLINNQCDNGNEYRCDNGQCIPKTFINDGAFDFECLDQSDESRHIDNPYPNPPVFQTEDSMCSWHSKSSQISLFTSSCIYQRHSLIEQSIFSEQSNTLPNDCFMALSCYLDIRRFVGPLCNDFCKDQLCIELINNTCPNMFYFPNIPIAYTHIYFAYTKDYIINSNNTLNLPPQYICYNNNSCNGLRSYGTIVSFDGKLCHPPEDFPVSFEFRATDWYNRYIVPVYLQLNSRCNNIPYDNSLICHNLTQYQCQNSSKCISKLHIGDGFIDCQYGDDEEPSRLMQQCLTDQSNLFYKCPTTNQCIHRSKVENDKCDCPIAEYEMCDDEIWTPNGKSRKLSFSTICDRSIDLLPIMINGQNETDETNCDKWPCNNLHTRCNDDWNCPNGLDETNCNPLPMLNCSSNHHICVSNITNQLICLPIEKGNDGIIDCLGGTDEPSLCPAKNNPSKQKGFSCKAGNSTRCLYAWDLCDSLMDCENADDERFCNTFSPSGLIAAGNQNQSDAQKFFREYFRIDFSSKSADSLIEKSTSDVIIQSGDQCQRGIPLRVYLDSEKNISTITCLCPPSYYGNRCQYQNQRVSLTLQLNTLPNDYSRPFTFVVSLIDDSPQRTVHSYQQFNYLYTKDQLKKFNIYLLYSKRPKDSTKQYAVHIDIYERRMLSYRGSLFIPLKFPFLPVERIAVEVNIPSADTTIETCSNNLCSHGRCIRHLNNSKQTSLCQCDRGWTGKYCDIPYLCTCSVDSLCLGIAANNRSICACPLNKFGSRCLLTNNVCQSNSCQNGGSCIPSNQDSTSTSSYACICPQGFTGSRCEIINTKMIVSFDKDIILSSKSIIPFHFIYLNNSMTYNQSYSLEALCENDTSLMTYWSQPFHVAFIKLPPNQYYFIYNQTTYQQSAVISKNIRSQDRCPSINEIFDSNIVQMYLIQRIKYYHLPCQNLSLNLSCFYDDLHMCLCYNFGNQHLTNCIEFNDQINNDDLNYYNNRLQMKCSSKELFNSSTTNRPTSNGMKSNYANKYLLMMLFGLYIHYTH